MPQLATQYMPSDGAGVVLMVTVLILFFGG